MAFTLRTQRISPRTYLALGASLFVVKFALDRLIARAAFGRTWSPLNYLIPNETYALPTLPHSEQIFFGTMLIVSLPFFWIGLLATVARLTDAGLPRWLVVLFFVPAVNLIFFVVLSFLPTVKRPPEPSATELPAAPVGPAAVPLAYENGDLPSYSVSHIVPTSAGGAAAFAVLAPIPFVLVMILLGVRVLENYGWGLFVGVPFVSGFASTVLYCLPQRRKFGSCAGIASLSLLASGVGLLFFGIEGAGCLVMCAPLAIPIAIGGAALGHAIMSSATGQRNPRRADPLWAATGFVPLLLAIESLAALPPAVQSVTTTIDVDASPAVVWNRVVTFSDIPKPDDLIFRAGVAYPTHARIEGTGVGAIRYCEFSTGPFVEPITAWDAGRLLKFDVTHNPPPMQEWSPYKLRTPHLDGFLVSSGGQFRLVELAGGRTRIEGTTWYRHTMWPSAYWTLWSDLIIHRIHNRVLTHVKTLSESTAN